jgi:ferredoxin-NADP reductase
VTRALLEPVVVTPGLETAVRTLVVASRTVVGTDVVALELRDPDGAVLPEWEPGAHIDLQVLTSDGSVLRQYSLCGDPADRHTWRIAVLRVGDGRGGSIAIHDDAGAGDLVEVHGPRNHFPLPDAAQYQFLAGGIGITPLLPMIAATHRLGRPWALAYGARSMDRFAFAHELGRYGDTVTLCAGVLDLAALLADCGSDTAVVACGPEPMLAALESVHEGSAWSLHLERFAPSTPPAGAADSAFEVVCARSGTTVVVSAGVSVLDALLAAGYDVDYSCHEGVCGTCETRVLRGKIDHRDAVLTADEHEAGDYMMVCVSRAAPGSRLVLDL